jgi:hypothetical protein
MKNIFLSFFLSFFCCNNTIVETPNKEYSSINAEALNYCKANDFNQEYYFLIDMSIHPGKNRFFIYDFKEKKITDKNLVTHGSCDKFEENPKQWEKESLKSGNAIIVLGVLM